MIGSLWARRLTQISSVAGWSDTEHTAVAVKPSTPCGPRGRDHMHGGAEAAHGLAKQRRGDRRDELLPLERGEGPVHGIVWTLINPTHASC